MADAPLLSTAYFPPAEYCSLIARSGAARIEKWENYHKQTYRNRCIILGANGPLTLTVPVLRGSFHKTPIRDILVDDGRRWRDLHLRGIISAYATAPYFEYYFETLRSVISGSQKFLLDLNTSALLSVLKAAGIDASITMTENFTIEEGTDNDFRYSITPKKKKQPESRQYQAYTQVFSDRYGFIPGLSIIDILLNNGPGTRALLLRSPDLKKE